MNKGIKPAPVRREILVAVPRDYAFRVFTADFGTWWPASHSIGTSPLSSAVIEPHPGGRWYEIGADGSECDWGRVLAWDAPERILLAWQIGGDWRFDPDLVTEVEVQFTAEAAERTRVTLEHRHLERMGEAMERARAAFESPNGWGAILARYAAAARGQALD